MNLKHRIQELESLVEDLEEQIMSLEEYNETLTSDLSLFIRYDTIETGKIVRVYMIESIRSLDRFTTELTTSTGVRVEVILYRAQIDQVVIYTPFEVVKYFEPTWKQK